ncbi:uncharacterized protein ACOB8E_017853 [Sarcophilus harrisii]
MLRAAARPGSGSAAAPGEHGRAGSGAAGAGARTPGSLSLAPGSLASPGHIAGRRRRLSPGSLPHSSPPPACRLLASRSPRWLCRSCLGLRSGGSGGSGRRGEGCVRRADTDNTADAPPPPRLKGAAPARAGPRRSREPGGGRPPGAGAAASPPPSCLRAGTPPASWNSHGLGSWASDGTSAMGTSVTTLRSARRLRPDPQKAGIVAPTVPAVGTGKEDSGVDLTPIVYRIGGEGGRDRGSAQCGVPGETLLSLFISSNNPSLKNTEKM